MGLSIGTIPELQQIQFVRSSKNISTRAPNGTILYGYEKEVKEHEAFVMLERICIAFFTVEYLLRSVLVAVVVGSKENRYTENSNGRKIAKRTACGIKVHLDCW